MVQGLLDDRREREGGVIGGKLLVMSWCFLGMQVIIHCLKRGCFFSLFGWG